MSTGGGWEAHSHASIWTNAVVHFNSCSLANTLYSVPTSFKHERQTSEYIQSITKGCTPVPWYYRVWWCTGRHSDLSWVTRWVNDRDKSAILHPTRSPYHILLYCGWTLWGAEWIRTALNITNKVSMGFTDSSHSMCWCIYTAQHKFYKELPPFTSRLFTLTTKLLPVLTAVQSTPLNSVATHQLIQGFLGHPQEAIFLLIMWTKKSKKGCPSC